ncbi:hypothetical protein JCM19037_3950 [Geomicrobium sp. JCM 19037]|nr:hypothetical protein JCM19037_3950 [Geomicrobium sp. JCM 19037]
MMKETAKTGQVFAVHAENHELIRQLSEEKDLKMNHTTHCFGPDQQLQKRLLLIQALHLPRRAGSFSCFARIGERKCRVGAKSTSKRATCDCRNMSSLFVFNE